MNNETILKLSSGKSLPIPIVQFSNYSKISQELNVYANEVAEVESKISIYAEIKCENLKYSIVSDEYAKEISESIIEKKIRSIYNDNNETLGINSEITIHNEGCIKFCLFIHLDILEKMRIENLQFLLETILCSIAVITRSDITVYGINMFSNITSHKTNNMNEIQPQGLKDKQKRQKEWEIQLQNAQNEYLLKEKAGHYQFLFFLFDKHNLSTKKIVERLQQKDTETLDKSYKLINESPIKQSIENLEQQQDIVELNEYKVSHGDLDDIDYIEFSNDTKIEYFEADEEDEITPIPCTDNREGIKELSKEEREELYYDMLRAEYLNDFREFSEKDMVDIPKNETVLCVYHSDNAENKDRSFISFINGNKKGTYFQKTKPEYFINPLYESIKIFETNNSIQLCSFFDEYKFWFVNHTNYTNYLINICNRIVCPLDDIDEWISLNAKNPNKKRIVYKNFAFFTEDNICKDNHYMIYILKKEEDSTTKSGLSLSSIERICKIITGTDSELNDDNIDRVTYHSIDYDLVVGSMGIAILRKNKKTLEFKNSIIIYLLIQLYNIKHNFFSELIKNEYKKHDLSIFIKIHNIKEKLKRILINIIPFYKHKHSIEKEATQLNIKVKEIQKDINTFNFFQYFDSPIANKNTESYNIWNFLATTLKLFETHEESLKKCTGFIKFIGNLYQERINKKIVLITTLTFFITIFSLLGNIDGIFKNLNILLNFFLGK